MKCLLNKDEISASHFSSVCCFIHICAKPFSLTKNEGKLFLVSKLSGPLCVTSDSINIFPVNLEHFKDPKCNLSDTFLGKSPFYKTVNFVGDEGID